MIGRRATAPTMFEQLARFERILVTGPQRSGTTIAARMIAEDLGYRLIDEDAIGWSAPFAHDERRFTQIWSECRRAVIQCPAMAYCIERFADERTCIVFMMRDVEAITASEHRISWRGQAAELQRYGRSPDAGPIARVKYEHWARHQKPRVPHHLEIDYATLKTHPLWLPPDERRAFSAKQTDASDPVLPGMAAFEDAFLRRDARTALRWLVQTLLDLDAERNQLTHWSTSTSDDALVMSIYTRIAAGITALFTDPNVELTKQDFEALSRHVNQIGHVFHLSGFGSADHVLSMIAARSDRPQPGRILFRSKSDARKFLLTSSLYTRRGDDLLGLLRADPQAVHPIILGILTSYLSAEPHAHRNRERLLASLGPLADVTPRADALGALHHVWALCSYATQQDRHDVKAVLNRTIANWLKQQRITTDTAPTPPRRDRPSLTVACEVIGGGHVMDRCFAAYLRQLRAHFHVTALVAEEDLRSDALDWADELVRFNWTGARFSDLVDQVVRLAPDVIYYPCVGMRLWGVLLSNLRLAPLQFATLGHPATTRSPYMDCVIAGRDMLGDPDRLSEKIVTFDCPGHLYDLSRDAPTAAPIVRERPDTVRIAVCANLLKLNHDFVESCARIARAAQRPVTFHFFPNCIGIRYQIARRQLDRLVRDAETQVHPRTDNATYRADLNESDLYLSTFPFGGENSTLDAVLSGLPTVTLEGPEPHARLDARVLRAVGAPDWCITTDRDAFESAACRLIDDDACRVACARALVDADVRRIFADECERYAEDFGRAVAWMYEHRVRIVGDARKVWKAGESISR
ncbi:MAG: hypothetical protein CMJ18_17490 [Phycisphaeraceae bacterium]|nr:hypothetical protein [Phycisphaeraceae bacterium]